MARLTYRPFLLLFLVLLRCGHAVTAAADDDKKNGARRPELVFTDAATRQTNLQTLFTNTELLLNIVPATSSTDRQDYGELGVPAATSAGAEWWRDETTSYQLFIDDKLYSSSTSGILVTTTTGADAGVNSTATSAAAARGMNISEPIRLVVKRRGTRTIRVELVNNKTTTTTTSIITREIQAYPSGLVIIPFVLLFLAFVLDNKLVMMFFTGVVVAGCFVTGNMIDGSNAIFTTYLVQALSADHVRIMLFVIFFSGLMGVLQRAGGLDGWTHAVLRCCCCHGACRRTHRTLLQGATVALGSLLCYDDILSVLVTGQAMRAASDAVDGSRQKMALLLDTTTLSSAMAPVSALAGLVLAILRRELVRLDKVNDVTPVDIVLESVQYLHYPIFMLALVLLLVITQRDCGPMLIAERKAIVRKVQEAAEVETDLPAGMPADQPARWWIFAVPMATMVAAAYLTFLASGEDDDDSSSAERRTFFDKLEHARLLPSLLLAMSTTVTASLVLVILTFSLSGGRLTFGPWYIANALLKRRHDVEYTPRSLVNLNDYILTLMKTAGRAFPTMIILVFSWATTIALSDVGVGNLTVRWMVGVSTEFLPTAACAVAAAFSFFTGSEILAVSALIPFVLEGALDRSHSTAAATVGAIVGGALAGRQLSPISQTTILVSSASGCTVRGHLASQTPYVLVAFTVTILTAVYPSVYPSWPNWLSYAVGFAIIALFALVFCSPVLCADGRYDILTELGTKNKNDLILLKQETADLFVKTRTRVGESPPEGSPQLKVVVYSGINVSPEESC